MLLWVIISYYINTLRNIFYTIIERFIIRDCLVSIMGGVIDLNQKNAHMQVDDVRISSFCHYGRCLQCGTCTASCPASVIYGDFKPRELMHKIEMGFGDSLADGAMIWRCGQCFSCKARCPRECSAAIAVLALREEALRTGKAPGNIMQLAAIIKNNLYTKGETMLPSTFNISLEAFGPNTARRCADNPARRKRLGYGDDDARATPVPEDALEEIRMLLKAVGFTEE